MQERLQKLIAQAGIASRRKAEELIANGEVTVNGEIVTQLGTKANPETDHIKVVLAFIAVLELVRTESIKLVQDKTFGDEVSRRIE